MRTEATPPRRLRFSSANAGFQMAALGLGRCNAYDSDALYDAAAHLEAAGHLLLKAAAQIRAAAHTEEPAALRLFERSGR